MTYHHVDAGPLEAADFSALADLIPRAAGDDRPFSREAFRLVAETGLFGAFTSTELPPAARMAGLMHALERLGETCGDGGFAFSVVTHLASTVAALFQFGGPALRARLMPDLIDGRLVGAHAISEPGAGSDALAMRTRAVRDGETYVLEGAKAYVTNGPVADVIVVYAKTGEGDGVGDVSTFLVPTDLPGVRRGPPLRKVGLETSPLGTLTLEDVRIPAENRLGREGSGFGILAWVMKREILFCFMTSIGAMRRRMDACVAYVNERHQFGASIGTNQAVSHKLADMKIRYELGRHFLLRTAEKLTTSQDVTADIAIAKVFVSEAAITTAIDALHVHGGAGFLADRGFGADVCDALAGTIYSGTNDIQRGRIAAMMGIRQ